MGDYSFNQERSYSIVVTWRFVLLVSTLITFRTAESCLCTEGSCVVNWKEKQQGYICKCSFNVLGEFVCYTDPDPCFLVTCFNGGTCRVVSNATDGYHCDCTNRFQGRTCQSDKCLGCGDHGTCVNDPTSDLGYGCQCEEGFTGVRCDVFGMIPENTTTATVVYISYKNIAVIVGGVTGAFLLILMVLLVTLLASRLRQAHSTRSESISNSSELYTITFPRSRNGVINQSYSNTEDQFHDILPPAYSTLTLSTDSSHPTHNSPPSYEEAIKYDLIPNFRENQTTI